VLIIGKHSAGCNPLIATTAAGASSEPYVCTSPVGAGCDHYLYNFAREVPMAFAHTTAHGGRVRLQALLVDSPPDATSVRKIQSPSARIVPFRAATSLLPIFDAPPFRAPAFFFSSSSASFRSRSALTTSSKSIGSDLFPQE